MCKLWACHTQLLMCRESKCVLLQYEYLLSFLGRYIRKNNKTIQNIYPHFKYSAPSLVYFLQLHTTNNIANCRTCWMTNGRTYQLKYVNIPRTMSMRPPLQSSRRGENTMKFFPLWFWTVKSPFYFHTLRTPSRRSVNLSSPEEGLGPVQDQVGLKSPTFLTASIGCLFLCSLLLSFFLPICCWRSSPCV